MKTIARLILAIALITLAFLVASAQEKATEKSTTIPTWVYTLPAPTNVLTDFLPKDSDGLARIDCSWTTGDSRIWLTAWGEGTNIVSLKLDDFKTERSFEWTNNANPETTNSFPARIVPTWKDFARQLFAGYKQIPGTEYHVALAPIKYLTSIERLTDHVVLTSYLFVDGQGRHKVIGEGEWVGEVPSQGEEVLLGSDGSHHFVVEKKGEKFLLSGEVLAGFRELERERRRIFPVADKK